LPITPENPITTRLQKTQSSPFVPCAILRPFPLHGQAIVVGLLVGFNIACDIRAWDGEVKRCVYGAEMLISVRCHRIMVLCAAIDIQSIVDITRR